MKTTSCLGPMGQLFFLLNLACLPTNYGFQAPKWSWYLQHYSALYAKYAMGRMLRWILPKRLVEKWVLALLWEERSDYWKKFYPLFQELKAYVRFERIRYVAMLQWDFSAADPLIAMHFSKSIREVVALAWRMPNEKRLEFLEGCFKAKINGEQLRKYHLGDESLLRQDIDILVSALKFTSCISEIQRLYDGVRLWLNWENVQPETRDKGGEFFGLCRERAALLGGTLSDAGTKMPYPYSIGASLD